MRIDPQKQHPASASAYYQVIYHSEQQGDYNVLKHPENGTSCMHKRAKNFSTSTPLLPTKTTLLISSKNSTIIKIKTQRTPKQLKSTQKEKQMAFVPKTTQETGIEEKASTQIKLRQESTTLMDKTRKNPSFGEEIRRKTQAANRRKCPKVLN